MDVRKPNFNVVATTLAPEAGIKGAWDSKVDREDVILPQKTLATLDRNVAGFMAARDALKSMQFQARKGLLFYGPPGTGKTHTMSCWI